MTLEEAITRLFKRMVKPSFERCKVVKVDKTAKTLVAEPIAGGANFLNVKLTSLASDNNVVVYPKVGTIIIIGVVSGADTYVAQVGEFDTIVYGKGKHGAPKTKDLVRELNKTNALLNTFLTVLNTPVNEPGNGAPSVFQAALNVALKAHELGDYSQIESNKLSYE